MVGETLKKYLIKISDPKIPDYVYSMFPSIASDKEKLEKVYTMYKAGNISDFAQAFFALRKSGRIITKIINFRIDIDRNIIIAKIPIDYPLVIPLDLLKTDDPDSLINELSKPLVVSCVYKRGYLLANEIKFGYQKTSTDLAKEIYEDVSVSSLLYAIGLHPEWKIFMLYLPRFMGLFKGFDVKRGEKPFMPIHIMQFTPPASGKSSFATRIESAFNFEYLGGEFPSLARLVGDARDGKVGIVALKDGVIFDEFEKVNYKIRQEFTEIQRDLQTGMEQGIWKRGKGAYAPVIYKFVNFIVFGNNDELIKSKNARTGLQMLYQIDGFSAFVDRFTVIDNVPESVDILKAVTGYVLPNHILRGLVEYLQSNMKRVEPNIQLESRYHRHLINVKSFLSTIGLSVPDTILADIVTGYTSFSNIRPASVTEAEKFLVKVDLSDIRRANIEDEIEEIKSDVKESDK